MSEQVTGEVSETLPESSARFTENHLEQVMKFLKDLPPAPWSIAEAGVYIRVIDKDGRNVATTPVRPYKEGGRFPKRDVYAASFIAGARGAIETLMAENADLRAEIAELRRHIHASEGHA